MRVVMYVLNDATRDSRVLREAASLAADGHEVTIMASALAPDVAAAGAPPPPPGVDIRRLPIPTGSRWWVTLVRAPWRLPPLGVLVLLPWVILRGAWVVAVNRILGRPVRAGGIDFIRRWRVEWLGWCRAAVAAAPAADIHHAHDMEALPAARSAARRDHGRYVYDSHEIHMAWGSILAQPRLLRWLLAGWERRMARGAAAFITVNDQVAAVLGQRLGLQRPVVVRNCAPRQRPPEVVEDRIRMAIGCGPDVAIVLCHGAFLPHRGLTETALAMLDERLGAAHLVLLGYGRTYPAEALVEPRWGGRVHLLPAVPPSEVVAWVAGADVDVIAIGPATENGRLSTPNKLFESLAAGVPVVVSDFEAMRAIVMDDPAGPLGEVCDPTSPASIAGAIHAILDLPPGERAALRERVRRSAFERWNWETEAEGLLSLYRELGASG